MIKFQWDCWTSTTACSIHCSSRHLSLWRSLDSPVATVHLQTWAAPPTSQARTQGECASYNLPLLCWSPSLCSVSWLQFSLPILCESLKITFLLFSSQLCYIAASSFQIIPQSLRKFLSPFIGIKLEPFTEYDRKYVFLWYLTYLLLDFKHLSDSAEM